MISPFLLSAFIKEAVAIREHELQAGDIILTSPRSTKGGGGLADKLFSVMQRRTLGRFGHAQMYLGNGEVMDHRFKDSKIRTLSDAVGDLDHAVIRPRLSQAERQKAVQSARSLVGSSFGRMNAVASGMSLLLPAKLRAMFVKPTRNNNTFCSSIINSAYGGKVAPHAGHLATPADLLHGGKTSLIHMHSTTPPTIPVSGIFANRKLPRLATNVISHLK